MSIFGNTLDSSHPLSATDCACGRHRSQAEHAYEAQRMLHCALVEGAPQELESRRRGVIAAAALAALSAPGPRRR